MNSTVLLFAGINLSESLHSYHLPLTPDNPHNSFAIRISVLLDSVSGTVKLKYVAQAWFGSPPVVSVYSICILLCMIIPPKMAGLTPPIVN